MTAIWNLEHNWLDAFRCHLISMQKHVCFVKEYSIYVTLNITLNYAFTLLTLLARVNFTVIYTQNNCVYNYFVLLRVRYYKCLCQQLFYKKLISRSLNLIFPNNQREIKLYLKDFVQLIQEKDDKMCFLNKIHNMYVKQKPEIMILNVQFLCQMITLLSAMMVHIPVGQLQKQHKQTRTVEPIQFWGTGVCLISIALGYVTCTKML